MNFINIFIGSELNANYTSTLNTKTKSPELWIYSCFGITLGGWYYALVFTYFHLIRKSFSNNVHNYISVLLALLFSAAINLYYEKNNKCNTIYQQCKEKSLFMSRTKTILCALLLMLSPFLFSILILVLF